MRVGHIAAGALAVAVGALVVAVSPGLTLAVVGGVIAVAVLVRQPQWTIPAAIAASFAATPALIPAQVYVGGITLFPYEPFLIGAALFLWLRTRADRRATRGLAILTGLVLLATAHGLETGVPEKAFGEARNLLTLVAWAFVVAHLVGTIYQERALQALKWVLWWSAGLTVAASATGLRLAGRTDVVTLSLISGQTADAGAARYITNATHLSNVVAAACVGLLASGRLSVRKVAPFLIPSLLLLGLSFSRNSLIVIAAASLYGLAATGSLNRLTRSATRAAGAAAVVLLLVVAAPHLRSVPGLGYVSGQLDAYSDRVIAGLSSNVRSEDYSVRYRSDETKAMLDSIRDAPVLGHGLGYPYRPLQPGYVTEELRFYGHNLYLWLAVKVGLVGLAVFLLAMLSPALRARRLGPRGIAGGAALVGVLAMCIVAPPPLGVVGVALGACARPSLGRRRARTNRSLSFARL